LRWRVDLPHWYVAVKGDSDGAWVYTLKPRLLLFVEISVAHHFIFAIIEPDTLCAAMSSDDEILSTHHTSLFAFSS
jgi:hypothetical protein